MTWLTALIGVALVVAVVAITGLKPRGTRKVAGTQLWWWPASSSCWRSWPSSISCGQRERARDAKSRDSLTVRLQRIPSTRYNAEMART